MQNCGKKQLDVSSLCKCGCDSPAKITEHKTKEFRIEFIYIDLEVCTRCRGTEENLKLALKEVQHLLETAGYDVKVNSILVESEEQAKDLRFVSSPTIRINGKDIELIIQESSCESCGSIIGTSVDCRVWSHEGRGYLEAPKKLIVEAILTSFRQNSPTSRNVKGDSPMSREGMNVG